MSYIHTYIHTIIHTYIHTELDKIDTERNILLHRAEEFYRKALKLRPNHVDTLCNRAALLHCHRYE